MLFQNKTSAGFFESKYKGTPDPWNFAASPYEQARYDRIITALSHRRYIKAFEPGCAIGVLTERLAALCDELDAADFSSTASQRAADRCAHLPNVHVTCAALTADTPLTGYDLVLLSEIGYYFKPKDWQAAVNKLIASLEPGATLLASHWLGHSRDHRQSGDEVHQTLRAQSRLRLEHEERHKDFRLDRFVCQQDSL